LSTSRYKHIYASKGAGKPNLRNALRDQQAEGKTYAFLEAASEAKGWLVSYYKSMGFEVLMESSAFIVDGEVLATNPNPIMYKRLLA